MKYDNRDPLKSLNQIRSHLLPNRLDLTRLSKDENSVINKNPLEPFLHAPLRPDGHETHHGLFKATSLPVKDVLLLLKDCVQGKFNEHLQDVLNNAEIEVAVNPQNPADHNSRKALEIKVKIVATAIDNYANLLAMVLGNHTLSKEDADNLHQAHRTLSNATGYLRCIELKQDFEQLPAFCNHDIEEHSLPCCNLFKPCFSRHSRQYEAVLQWFENLTTQPLSEYELVGGIYCIRTQLDVITHRTERDALRDGLDNLLKKYHYPLHTEEGHYDYLRPFISRAPIVKLQLPPQFIFPTQAIVMDMTM